ncbi:MAG: hypothetical protein ACKVP0_03225 [Pirellulaceae bacterium]
MLATQFPVSATSSRLLGKPGGELQFRIQGGEHHGRILRIAASKCSIGSAPGCTLRLRGDGIEPLHCLILTGKKGTVVRRNSPRTYLNGGSFEDAALQVGDILGVGPIELAVVDCPQAIGPTPHSNASAPVDASYFEQAAAVEQRIAAEVNRALEGERGEQQRLAIELDQLKEQVRTAQEQLANAQRMREQAALENQLASDQLREQHAQVIERTFQQQREEQSEGLERESRFQSELRHAQQCAQDLARRLAARQALAEQQTADDQQTIVQLQQELRKERNQRRQERADDTTIQRELESALALLHADSEAQRGQLSSMQEAGNGSAARIRELEIQLDEARQLGQQGQDHGLSEQQRLREEFTSVRNRLETCIASLTEQLQKREAELAAAHDRGGECAGTLTYALDEARCELRGLQIQRSQEECERTAFRVRLEEQLADLTTRLVEREKELASCDVELTELRQKAALVDASQQIVRQLQETVTASQATHQVERDSWLTERNELQRQQSELVVEVSQGESQRMALEEQCRTLENSRNELHLQCQALEARCATLQNTFGQSVQQLEDGLATVATAHRSEREMWQAERSQLESQRFDLESARSHVESQLLELQNQHGDLQSRFASLEIHNTNLQSLCTGSETRRSELETEVTQLRESARRVDELERELADLRGRRDEAVAYNLTEQAAKLEAIRNYEEQVERWQSEAHKWQLQAEEFSGQVGPMQERCSNLEIRKAELQAAMHATNVAAEERQNFEFQRAQLEIQGKDLAAVRAQLQEEQTQLANLCAETSSREETLARLESELREREAAWENSHGEQAAALEERSQRIAAQIAQFESEQAAFARQQATIIQQMSSLEDRVQELTNASNSRPSQVHLASSQPGVPSLPGNPVSEEPSKDGEDMEISEDSTMKSTRRLEARPEAAVADVAPLQSAKELSAEERDLVVRRLMLAVESKGGDGEKFASASLQAKKSTLEKSRYSPPSFLDQAAEMARQEDLASATVQRVDDKSFLDSHAAKQTNGSSAPLTNDDDDESIEQYMNRLLSRVRGGNSTAASDSVIPRPQPTSAASLPNCAPVASSDSPTEPKEYVPRTLAPEPPERLSQMRELANSAAKSAIHTHARQSQKLEIKHRSLLALTSLAGGTSLFTVGCFTGSTLAFLGSLGFVAACCFLVLRAVTGSFRQLPQQPLPEVTQKQGAEDCSQIGV